MSSPEIQAHLKREDDPILTTDKIDSVIESTTGVKK